MNSRSAHILVAEDDKSVRLVVQQALARQGYTVQSSGTAAGPVSYTHLRAHETDSYLVCRLLLEK